MELIDILDEHGEATGVVKPKPDVHRDGDWHRSVHVWIFTPDDRVLVQRRALTKENNPGLWDVSCAGHIAAGETAVEAAIREAEEELGLEISAEELQHLTTIRAQSILNGGTYLDNEFHEIFLVRRPVDAGALRLQPEEVDAAQVIECNDFWALPHVDHGEEYTLIFGKLIPRKTGEATHKI